MVDTTASTTAASRRREPCCWRPALMAACSSAVVSWSRTIVCASTPGFIKEEGIQHVTDTVMLIVSCSIAPANATFCGMTGQVVRQSRLGV